MLKRRGREWGCQWEGGWRRGGEPHPRMSVIHRCPALASRRRPTSLSYGVVASSFRVIVVGCCRAVVVVRCRVASSLRVGASSSRVLAVSLFRVIWLSVRDLGTSPP